MKVVAIRRYNVTGLPGIYDIVPIKVYTYAGYSSVDYHVPLPRYRFQSLFVMTWQENRFESWKVKSSASKRPRGDTAATDFLLNQFFWSPRL